MAESSFKVIVIGGGPNGLTVAHSLHHAGIDFVVLERREEAFEDVGASLVLAPQNLRVFHQFGLLDKLLEIGAAVHDCRGFTVDGRNFKKNSAFDIINTNHGIHPLAYHRAHLVQALYDGLPEEAKSKYHTGKKLTDIVTTEKGVEVTCADGSKFCGSLVIGADGVHSQTRRTMRRLAIADSPDLEPSWDAENPFKTRYKCMWASFPRSSGPGESFETQNTNRSVMYITGKEKGWIFLYERLPKKTSERATYNDHDIEAFSKLFADIPINESLKVKDVFHKRTSAGMANLEEGVVKHWSWGGKLVLVGDACHKFTPNAGMGLNNGIQDVVALCNRLQKVVCVNMQTSPETLQKVFEDYRKERIDMVNECFSQSAHLTRMQAWANGTYFFLARYVFAISAVQELFVKTFTSPSVKKGLVIDYISSTEPLRGKVAWDYPIKSPA